MGRMEFHFEKMKSLVMMEVMITQLCECFMLIGNLAPITWEAKRYQRKRQRDIRERAKPLLISRYRLISKRT